jgi:hypothetical protein
LINLNFSSFIVLYLSVGLAIVLGLWIYYEQRDQRIYDRERSQSLFHCLKCGRLYSAPRFEQAVCCPGCNFENSKLKF